MTKGYELTYIPFLETFISRNILPLGATSLSAKVYKQGPNEMNFFCKLGTELRIRIRCLFDPWIRDG
jgi:hypothetical protein